MFVDQQEGFSHPIWGWNGDEVRPTFTPSILAQWRGLTPSSREQHRAWVNAGCPKPAPDLESAAIVCHSFVTDGQIRFLGDCTHELAGQTVPLEPF